MKEENSVVEPELTELPENSENKEPAPEQPEQPDQPPYEPVGMMRGIPVTNDGITISFRSSVWERPEAFNFS